MLELHTQAPGFTLPDHDGVMRSLSDFLGTKVLLYFYPKDDTPGCTKEACAIRDIYHDFEKNNVQVLGMSKDSPAAHTKFRQKYELPFMLLSDKEGSTISAYHADGILAPKRISYLIDETGVIQAVFPKVDPASHAVEVLRLVASSN
jgi:peroxiredoxin Q/BCP